MPSLIMIVHVVVYGWYLLEADIVDSHDCDTIPSVMAIPNGV
jgi:hypothetical protein